MGMPNKCGPRIPTCGPGISTGCAVEHKRLEALIKKETEDRTETEEWIKSEVAEYIDTLQDDVDAIQDQLSKESEERKNADKETSATLISLTQKIDDISESIKMDGGEIVAEGE